LAAGVTVNGTDVVPYADDTFARAWISLSDGNNEGVRSAFC
jgi:hypothetical protein